jgi:hypothetical protein
VTPVNKKILVSCNMRQKDTMTVGGMTVRTAIKWETNYREKSPVVCCVAEGNKILRKGQILLAHHNTFYAPSPFYLYDDLFAVPANHTLFAIIHHDGGIQPIYGNIICKRVEVPSLLPLPPEQRKTYTDRVVVVNPGNTPYKEGDLLFHRKNAAYDIVYIINNTEHRITKIHEEWIVGLDRPKS